MSDTPKLIKRISIVETCPVCGKDIESDWVCCPWCSNSLKKDETSEVEKTVKHKPKQRGNGTGTVFQRGKTWTALVTIGYKTVVGKDGREKISRVTRSKGGFKRKTDALLYCQTLSQCDKPTSTETFYQIFIRWSEMYEKRISESCMATYKAAFEYFKTIHHRKVTDICFDDLQKCIDACPRKRSTKNNMRTVADLVFRYCEQNDLITRNPSKNLDCGREPKGTHDAFTPDELEKIKNSVGTVDYADYVYFLCYVGFRPGELLAMKKTSYDAEHNCLVGGSKTKAGKNRTMPISPKIADILKQRLETDNDYLFPLKNGKPMNDEQFRRQCFMPLMEKLGIEGKVPYSCRHTFANMLKNVVGSSTDKAALMGHSDTSMTEYYQSADFKSLSTIIAQI